MFKELLSFIVSIDDERQNRTGRGRHVEENPQPQPTLLENCDKELVATDLDIQTWRDHIASIEGELHKLQERQAARNQRKKEAHEKLATLREAQATSATYVSISTGTESHSSATTAYQKSVTDVEAMTREASMINSQCALQEKADLAKMSELQVQLSSSREILAMRQADRQRLTLARDQALEQKGLEAQRKLSMAFLSLEDQIDGLQQSLQFCQAERKNLAELAHSRLAEHS